MLTLELDGKKASQNFSFRADLSPITLVSGVVELLQYATPDSAESIPEITDSLSVDSCQFKEDAISEWVSTNYETAYACL